MNLKDKKVLMIVESPHKSKTITSILKKAGYPNIKVVASVGHIQTLADDKTSWKNSGIWPDKKFKANFTIAPDKLKTVHELKEYASQAEVILVATDPDREGYVIADSLMHFLNLPEDKSFRVVTHEITPKAIVHAIENPVSFNQDLVDAGYTRAIVDKMIGWGFSPWARLYIGAKSAGRTQCAGLMLVAEREKEIKEFKSTRYYDLFLNFEKNGTKFRAKYIGTEKEEIDHLSSYEQVQKVKHECIKDFKILDIKRRDKFENPKPPFDTPTFQQEASSKLGLTVKDAQSCAQKLFEGLDIGGDHVGLVTYIRTDSTEISEEFIPTLKEYVDNNFGKDAFNKPRVGKKTEHQQDGHECLRCTDPNLTPEKLAKYIKNDLLLKVYKLIWQRTIASALPPAKIAETTYLIENNGQRFNLISNELVEPGYKSIYNYKEDEKKDDTVVQESFEINEKLKNCELEDVEKFTKPKPRFKEGTFINELKKRGIGRPSTYQSILDTLISPTRGYCNIVEKEIVPTQLGMSLIDALSRAFPDTFSIDYTSRLESDLDDISTGKLKKLDYLNGFYENLVESLNKNTEGNVKDSNKVCPNCGSQLVTRRNRWGKLFLGCSSYPKCNYIENLK